MDDILFVQNLWICLSKSYFISKYEQTHLQGGRVFLMAYGGLFRGTEG